MFISMNMVTFHFKKEEWREAFSVKVSSPFERPNMTQRFWGIFGIVYMGNQEHNSFEVVTRMPHVTQWNASPHTHTFKF